MISLNTYLDRELVRDFDLRASTCALVPNFVKDATNRDEKCARSGLESPQRARNELVGSGLRGIAGRIGSCGAGGGPSGRLGPSRSFDWRTERSSGLWNLAFLARGAEIMALSRGRGPTFYSPYTHPTPAHSGGIWLCSQSAKKMFWCEAGHDGGYRRWWDGKVSCQSAGQQRHVRLLHSTISHKSHHFLL